ncbi:Gfo/Idh/MocA family protein [Asticcacaulis sp. AC402]|uniref:Gfo/Idh/MocA family protein n=1 Tax=Asticcacaulis sp. AC402 TaxID=1282361 RepID=UPI0003C3FFD4|nr:Gfo/Idh/MocA family oxidoreductase [Asticcacaulis sp. AC402]ESQ74908.1 oxidoreductase [Asticcacaulis sp. AC402]
MQRTGRREFLLAAGLTPVAMMGAGVPEAALAAGQAAIETLPVLPEEQPKHKIRFGVVGMSHDHIYGMAAAVMRGGGELVSAWGSEPDKLANFTKRFPNVPIKATQDEIINDPSLQVILTSQVPNERTQIGLRAMRAGKDVLADKPGIITLKELAEVRKAIKSTGRMYKIQYSERLDVRAAVHAGELIRQGAIGTVIQTINLAPHQIFQNGGDAGGGGGRPDWFWDDTRFGGILADIGSHQVDQFLYYTGSTKAEIVTSQVANLKHPDRPKFQDFGDMMLRSDRGFGYIRLDWFTPKGLGTWGDGRLFILGTDGYIEARKYINVGVEKKGNLLIVVNQQGTRVIDCTNGPLPFGPQFVDDVVNRTHTAQDQDQALLAAELSIKAQKNAKRINGLG